MSVEQRELTSILLPEMATDSPQELDGLHARASCQVGWRRNAMRMGTDLGAA